MTGLRMRSLVPPTLVCLASALAAAAAPPVPVYVGTYTDGGSRGIYRFELDPSSGAATAPILAGGSENPSFLAVHPNGRVLYAVNEVAKFGGAPTGAVSAFAIDPASGELTRATIATRLFFAAATRARAARRCGQRDPWLHRDRPLDPAE